MYRLPIAELCRISVPTLNHFRLFSNIQKASRVKQTNNTDRWIANFIKWWARILTEAAEVIINKLTYFYNEYLAEGVYQMYVHKVMWYLYTKEMKEKGKEETVDLLLYNQCS